MPKGEMMNEIRIIILTLFVMFTAPTLCNAVCTCLIDPSGEVWGLCLECYEARNVNGP